MFKKTDFVHGEVVTTTTGYEVRAVFGEIPTRKTTSNGWLVEAAFYE